MDRAAQRERLGGVLVDRADEDVEVLDRLVQPCDEAQVRSRPVGDDHDGDGACHEAQLDEVAHVERPGRDARVDVALDEGRRAVLGAGVPATKALNRTYFRSVYFPGPGGATLELATRGPGFTVDEPLSELGLALKLPAWLEPERQQIRAQLPVTASPEYTHLF